MTNAEMLAKMEELVSLTIPSAFTMPQVRDLLQTAYDYNMTFYCPVVPAKDHPDFFHHSYRDINGKWYYELFTSPEQFKKSNRKAYSDGIELLDAYFQILFDDVKTRKNFGGFSINSCVDRKGNVDPGYLVKLRGPGCVRILQNGRRPTAPGAHPSGKGSSMTQDELWDKMDAAARLLDVRRVRMAIASLLKKAYAENIPLLCVAVPTPNVKPGSSKLLFQPLGGKQYVVLLTRVSNFAESKKVANLPEAYLAVLEARYVLGEVFAREEVSGLALNPWYVAPGKIGTFIISKRDLPFGKSEG